MSICHVCTAFFAYRTSSGKMSHNFFQVGDVEQGNILIYQRFWSRTQSYNLVRVLYELSVALSPQTLLVPWHCLEVPSCIHARTWHKILRRSPASSFSNSSDGTSTLLCPARLWKAERIHFVPVCLNRGSVTHHKDVILCWLDLFLVWKRGGTCCCLHSLLSVGDGGTSLLSCTGLVHQRIIQFFEDLIRSPRIRAFKRTDAVSTLFFTRYITEREFQSWVSKLLTQPFRRLPISFGRLINYS